MKILLSAYACKPRHGSEPGVGWHWAQALAEQGHQVTVVTRASNREAIETELSCAPIPGLTFRYFDLPRFISWWFVPGRRGVRLYYVLWQIGVYPLACRLAKTCDYDLSHHITFGVHRHPSLFSLLPIPFILGPVGGGDSAPWPLRRSFPWQGWCKDLFRDIANFFAMLDPLTRLTLRKANLILCRTANTMAQIPMPYRAKCRVQLEIGTDTSEMAIRAPLHRRPPHEPLRIIFAGRLIYLKGLHLALKAFAELAAHTPDVTLTIVGKGPDERWLRNIAQKAGIADSIDWQGWVPRADLMGLYPKHHLFLFPSLRDSSGTVVLEALGSGLPVVCLDLGGPATIVDSSCGSVVQTSGCSEAEVITRLAASVRELADNESKRLLAAQGALQKGREHTWSAIVRRTYSQIERQDYLASQKGRVTSKDHA